MSSKIGGHIVGIGTLLSMPVWEEETYRDKKINNVKFTNEPKNDDYDELCARLSGEVVSYHINDSRCINV